MPGPYWVTPPRATRNTAASVNWRLLNLACIEGIEFTPRSNNDGHREIPLDGGFWRSQLPPEGSAGSRLPCPPLRARRRDPANRNCGDIRPATDIGQRRETSGATPRPFRGHHARAALTRPRAANRDGHRVPGPPRGIWRGTSMLPWTGLRQSDRAKSVQAAPASWRAVAVRDSCSSGRGCGDTGSRSDRRGQPAAILTVPLKRHIDQITESSGPFDLRASDCDVPAICGRRRQIPSTGISTGTPRNACACDKAVADKDTNLPRER